MKKDDCFYLGSLIKTHGAKGEILLKSEYQLDEYTELESVFFEINKRLVPFFISQLRPKSSNTYLIIFDDINSDEKAREFIGSEVYLSSSFSNTLSDNENELNLQDLIGFKVFDENDNEIGGVIDFHKIPSNPLLVIKNNEKEMLIPYQKDYILNINTESKKVYCSLPEGFANLNN